MAKRRKSITGIEHIAYSNLTRAMNRGCTGGSGLFDAIFFTLRESRKTPDPALPRVRSSRLRLRPRRLGSEALRLLRH